MKDSSRPVTLADIARATGLSVNTVSRALKNKDDISRETCKRVQQVAHEMVMSAITWPVPCVPAAPGPWP